MDLMQAVSAASRESEPTPEDLNIVEGLGRSPLNIQALEKFAQNMAENIIQSLLSQMQKVEPKGSNPDQAMLAEEMASAVIEVALREVCRGHNVKAFPSATSAGVKISDGQAENQTVLKDYDPVKELQSSKDTQPYHPPLSQSGLPIVGSLDYPDAPPTTPLLPELERSRHSFARKLKGGLAKVFLPSPPPPTPKDKEDGSDGTVSNPQMELMEHLMHSLCTDDMATDYLEVASQHGASTEAFAEALSCDIIECVLSGKSREQIADDSNLHLLAQQLAETIITTSLDEAKMLI